MTLRPYQSRAVSDVLAAYREGARRVCLVIPTGGGKTRVGTEIVSLAVSRARRVLWLAHRIELIDQALTTLRAAGLDAAAISPQHACDSAAVVQVASLDTLTARGERPAADLVVLDECHHAQAATYRAVLEHYDTAWHLGLTATPQRSDGRPLGDCYERLLVGARYSELIAAGHLVPCRVATTEERDGYLGSGIARAPLEAWQQMRARDGDRPTLAYAPGVERAHEWAQEFAAAGVPSGALDGTTPAAERRALLDAFRDGKIRVLFNVFCLTEGLDIPSASCVLLARGCEHAGTYLQMVGRALRPADGKQDARLVDLAGAYWLHGAPTADREYALDGRAIRTQGESLKNCPQCGYVTESGQPACPSCGYEFPARPRPKQRIYSLELRWEIEAAGGEAAAVGENAKRREWERLLALCDEREFALGWARREYKSLFGTPPESSWSTGASETLRRRELAALTRVAHARGYSRGWIAHRYRAAFGVWPGARPQGKSDEAR